MREGGRRGLRDVRRARGGHRAAGVRAGAGEPSARRLAPARPQGAVDSAIGAKRVCHEITKITMCNTGSFVNCENGKLIPW